jgi:hypothetical protein
LHIREIPQANHEEIYVDASTSWGLGFVWKKKWLAWKLKDSWRTDGRDIGWAEMVAVFLAVTILVAGNVRDAHFILRSDNTGVCGSFVAGRARNSAQNDILKHMVDLLRDHDIFFTVKWISTVENLADAPSRGCLPPLRDMFPHNLHRPQFLKKLVENPVRAETWAKYASCN